MAIRTNSYAQVREGKLFGKVGFQTMSDKTDPIILSNMKDLEASLDAGELRDLDGNVVHDNAVITVQVLVQKVQTEETRKHISAFTNADGSTANVPEPSDNEEECPF